LLGVGFGLGGCDDDDCIECLDDDPPAVPTGVFSVTGNGQVTVYWNDIWQRDLIGYLVWRDDDDPDSVYELIADVAWDENFDEQSGLHWFTDRGLQNGRTYYYAVSSYDAAGNESELSFENVFDTPRPEGFQVEMFDHGTNPNLSGFDFSDLVSQAVPGGAAPADIRVVWRPVGPVAYPFVEAVPRQAAGAGVALQDYGTVMNADGEIILDWVSYAPLDGYAPSGRAELILGHAYIVRIAEGPNDVHYAKFAVTVVRGSSVVIDWAYQVAEGNRELKVPPVTSPPGTAGALEIVHY
jgi:hypothetical protein